MAVFSIVKLSELEGARRIDAEFYKPEYLETKSVMLKLMVKSLAHISNYVTNGHTPRHADLTSGEVIFLTAEDVFDFYLSLQTAKRITKEDSHKFLYRSIVRKNDLLITIKGKIGNTAVVNEINEEININQDIARVVLKQNVNPFFVAGFMNSKFGQLQVKQLATGQINPFLGLGNLKQIKIPLLSNSFQTVIEIIVKKSLKSQNISHSLYTQAENLLLEELGLKDYKPEYKKTYTARLSDCFTAKRIDAEYFQPAYEDVIEKIRSYKNGFDKLLNYVENVKPDFDPNKFPDKYFRYIELADIDTTIGTIQNANKIKGEEAPSRARRILRKDDVIVSSVEGSLEKVALVDQEHDGCLASTGFLQFRPKKILPEVLLVISKTIVLQIQLKKECSGTILTAVSKEAIKDIIIPLLPLSIQQQIAELVKKSHEARKKAKELLEIAKKAVEIAIEKNEEEAIEFLNSNMKTR